MTKSRQSEPATRAQMLDAGAIRTRMGDDIASLHGERGGVESWHLTELGWTAAQIRLHAQAVADALKLAA